MSLFKDTETHIDLYTANNGRHATVISPVVVSCSTYPALPVCLNQEFHKLRVAEVHRSCIVAV